MKPAELTLTEVFRSPQGPDPELFRSILTAWLPRGPEKPPPGGEEG